MKLTACGCRKNLVGKWEYTNFKLHRGTVIEFFSGGTMFLHKWRRSGEWIVNGNRLVMSV